jgi:hypothetical protein
MKLSQPRASFRHSSRYIAGIAPLLLSLVVSQAYAADRTVTGPGGAVGTPGTATTPNGGAGGAARDLTDTSLTAGAFNRLTLTGGNGGVGGAGLAPVVLNPNDPDCVNDGMCFYGNGGLGGNGGAGAAALGRVNAVSVTGATRAEANVFGGNGGHVGEGEQWFSGNNLALNNGGAGGNASSSANAVSVSGAVSASAYATGGNGGDSLAMQAGRGGDGGKATARASAYSGTGNVAVLAQATGGNGGGANNVLAPAGAGAAVTLENMVAGATRGVLSLLQHAIGGNGGLVSNGFFGDPETPALPTNNVGGNAASVLRISDGQASALKATVTAKGGNAGGKASTAKPAAGGARAELYLTSTRNGSDVEGAVKATGGDITSQADGGDYSVRGGAAGAATAIATLTGKAAVLGTAEAFGGQFGDGYWPDGAPAGASATSLLTINAGGLATGSARAVGGRMADQMRAFNYEDGDASATLVLVGAGASGSSNARGRNATSSVNVTTTGARAVNVESRATAGLGDASSERGTKGDARASTVVNAGTTAGRAAVTAGAYALGSGGYQSAHANLRVETGGDIVGTAQAEAGLSTYEQLRSGNAEAVARGVTTGAHSVTLSALARSPMPAGLREGSTYFGNAAANAYGASGSGVVTVAAEALGGVNYSNQAPRPSTARAVAETSALGGVSNASARARGEQIEAVAMANAVGAKGSPVGFIATTTGGYAQGSAVASNRFDAASFALKAGNGTGSDHQLYTYAGAAPADGAGLSATAAAAMTDQYGAGMHGASGGVDRSATPALADTNISEFQFTSAVDQHLLIAFLGAGGTGFDSLDLSISSHGSLLFSQSFTSLSDANLFFTGKVLDLGMFGAGAQDIVVRSSLAGAAYGYAFNYVLGGGLGGLGNTAGGVPVLAVPEESSWMMMMIGLSGLVIVARRRKSAAARA